MRTHTAKTIALQKVSKERADYNRFWYAQAARIKQEMVEHLDRRAKQKSEDQSTPGFGLYKDENYLIQTFAPYTLPKTNAPSTARESPTTMQFHPSSEDKEAQEGQPQIEPQSTQNTEPQSAQNTDPQSSQNADPQSIKNTNPQSSDIKDYKHYRIIAEHRSFGVEVYTTGLTDQTGPITYTARTESTNHQCRGDRQANIVFHDPFHDGGYNNKEINEHRRGEDSESEGQKRLRRPEEGNPEQGFHQREVSPRNVPEHVGSNELHDSPTADQPANMIAPAKVSNSALGGPNMMSSAESIPPTTVGRLPRLPFEKSSQLTERAVSLGSVGTRRQDSSPSEKQGNNLVRLSRELVIPEFTTLSSKSEPMMDNVQVEIAAGHVRTIGSTSESLAPKPTTSHSSEPEVPTTDDQTIGSTSESAALEQTTLHSSEPEVPTIDDQTTGSTSESTAPEPTTSPLSEHATTINIPSSTKHVLEISTRSKTLVTCFVTFLVILLFGSILLYKFYSTSTTKHATVHSTYS
ncbi:hypothetical protein TI39_contig408g00011 [Zymoseptoria brevis]|uniref:Uncharacterized protein n=1 Tax=Zymoseptoria brevis TaxID=1047168 RepID=A0A0F4GQQ0_9PEZI|nr:hypothetical protein TI39_contig408g00011 [Zymoseptoria brevis]